MRAVIQRVVKGTVIVNGEVTGSIGKGLVVLIGIHPGDTPKDIEWMADKLVHLRIFEDPDGKMNLSATDIGAEMLIVSQFTLYGDCRKGRRPGYSTAAPPAIAEPVYLQLVDAVRKRGIDVGTGIFQAIMQVELINDGPVTLLIDSEKKF
ncbi:D-aminoacyl-tRNA deacylase [Desulfopila sp. IMCC35008]|uniref:D-aminoacyl-tRNA deacylase n=1 Tax=Desulfopila sp. IMCC35008 TaxID=2653858 RepID=UPI0013D26E10